MTGRAALDRAEPAELDRIYRSESPRLMRLFARRVGEGEAADLVQESFARLARRSAGDPPVERPLAFLQRVALNLLRNPAELAKRRRQAQSLSLDELAPAGTDPHALVEARDLLARIEQAITKMPPRTREVFVARRVEGLTYAEIAARTGLSTKRIERHMTKAIAALDRMVPDR